MSNTLHIKHNGSWVPLTQLYIIGGSSYSPLVWNESGVLDCFYIDFKQPLQPFSTSMFNNSIIVLGNSVLTPSKVSPTASPSVYKVQCDISSCTRGLVVGNYRTNLLRFTNGEAVPAFSVYITVEGISTQLDCGYLYDSAVAVLSNLIRCGEAAENWDLAFITNLEVSGAVDYRTYHGLWRGNVSEAQAVTLI